MGIINRAFLLFPSWEKVRYLVVGVFLGIAKGMRSVNSMPFVITKNGRFVHFHLLYLLLDKTHDVARDGIIYIMRERI